MNALEYQIIKTTRDVINEGFSNDVKLFSNEKKEDRRHCYCQPTLHKVSKSIQIPVENKECIKCTSFLNAGYCCELGIELDNGCIGVCQAREECDKMSK